MKLLNRWLTILWLAVAIPALFAQQSQKPLSNDDVIRMVKAGVPDSTIISAIKSTPAKFDLSPDALVVLHKEGVNEKILQAMVAGMSAVPRAAGPAGGTQADELNPQPYPPRVPGSASVAKDGRVSPAGNKAALAGKAVAMPLKMNLGAPKTGPQVKNPRAVQAEISIIAVLQKQRQAADGEASRMMKLGIREQGQVGVSTPQSQQTQAVTDGSKPTLPAVMSPQPTTVAGNKSSTSTANRNAAVAMQSSGTRAINGDGRTASAAAAGTTPGSAGQIGPSQTMSSSGNNLTSMDQLHYMDTTALTCAHDPTFRILNISGSSFPATFTPINQYNLYTIKGCSFGNSSPNDKVYIFGTGSFQGNFIIKFWSDNSIVLSLDPALSGYPDLDNITLVIQRADGQQFQKSGFKFYAARGDAFGNPVPLQQFPSGRVQLNQGPNLVIQVSSPVSNPPGTAAVVSRNFRIEMDRTTSNATINGQNDFHVNKGIPASFPYMPPSSYKVLDFFDASHLATSFSAVSAELLYWTPDAGGLCGAGDDLQRAYSNEPNTGLASSPWNLQWVGDDHIGVEGPLYSCWDLEVFKENLVAQSQYALQVWVMGPRCLDPYTGQPDPTCIADVKQKLAQLQP